MKTHIPLTRRILLGLALFAVLPAGLQAQNPQGEKFGHIRLFVERVYTMAPNIEVILGLTDEQCTKIEEALSTRKNDPVVLETIEAHRSAKLNGDKEAEAEAAKAKEAASREAKRVCEEKLSEILNGDQMAKIEKLNVFLREVQEQARPELEELRAAAGSAGSWNQELELVSKKARERITEVLTPEEVKAVFAESTPAQPEGQ